MYQYYKQYKKSSASVRFKKISIQIHILRFKDTFLRTGYNRELSVT